VGFEVELGYFGEDVAYSLVLHGLGVEGGYELIYVFPKSYVIHL
jgi:hypothetical protein